ncbi:MAG: sulfite exporter TauE/SafE family protein [Oscillospiraceae bacterium]
MSFWLNIFAGAVCGVLSGCGIGGGSLLLIYMTHFASLPQTTAQGINLLYFIPTSFAALISHFKNKLVDKAAMIYACLPGTVCSFFAALAATSIDSGLLRKFFGIFLILIGVKMLIKRKNA